MTSGKPSPRTRLLVGLALLGLLGGFTALRFEVTTDITAFLPPGGDREQLAMARQIAESELSRTMVLNIGAPSPEQAAAASTALEEALRSDREVAAALAFIEGGPPEGTERAVYDLYHPRRLGFLADSPRAARAKLTDEGLRHAAKDLRKQLSQPMSPLLGRLAPGDPLLVMPALFERMQGARGDELRVQDGRFVTRDGRHAVLFLASKARAFDSRAQAPLLAGIRRAFDAVNADFANTLSLDQSGINRFAVRTEQAIKGDIQRVSVLSVVGLSLLMWLVFRSFRLVLLTALPLGAGVLAGISTSLLLYGRVHGMTLAFGASLLGVALDYVVHLYCHHAVARGGDAQQTLRAIAPALLTGAATTLVGFMALAGAGFAGLQEVALFASAGISAALAATFFMLPALLPDTVAPVQSRERLVAGLASLLRTLRANRARLWLLPVAAMAIVAVGLPRAFMSDDLMSPERLDPELLAEDERVRSRVARFDQMRFVVAVHEDEDTALEHNAAAARTLAEAVAAGELEGYRGIDALLPSAAQQRAVASAVRAEPRLFERLAAIFEQEGFRAAALTPFQVHLEQPPAEPLRYDDLLQSPLAPMVRPFRVRFGERVGFVNFLHGVERPEQLAARLAGLDGVTFLEQGKQLAEAQHAYQRRTVLLLCAGLVAVLLLLALRYRQPAATIATFVPSVLAAAVTVAVLALTGRGLDLVVLTALLMVVSMGVDYGVFLVDAQSNDDSSAALLSVLVAAASTVLGFGLLALSEHPLLQSIGLTATVGMVSCLLLAPTTLVLASRTPGEQTAKLGEDAS